MIFIRDVAMRTFDEAVADCIGLSNKYSTTVVLVWSGKPIIFKCTDPDFIKDLSAYYEWQKVENSSAEEFKEIAKYL